jgi:hypothetical protein
MGSVSSNRLKIGLVREDIVGVTPADPRVRTIRVTGEQLTFTPTYVTSSEIRDDRMDADPALAMKEAAGSINFEFSYPDDETPLSEALLGGFYASWVNTPTLFNDGTADSVITDAGTTTDTFAVAAGGAAFKASLLAQASGFTNSSNNQVFKVTSSTGTTVVGSGLGLTAEASPPGTAQLKVVGFEGASGDIQATSGGLESTTLDFTTLGLAVGQWLKIGSATATANSFATAADNAFVRINAIAAHTITLDNLPPAWGADAGAGKTIRCWFGDQIKNGVIQTSWTIEKSMQGQQTPVYITYQGMVVDQLSFDIESRKAITGSVSYKGMGGGEATTTIDADYDPATTSSIMTANASVGRVAAAGSQLTDPNWCNSLKFQVANNLNTVEAVDASNPVAIYEGECAVTGTVNTYFGSDTLLAQFYAGNPTSVSSRFQKNGQAVIFQIPRCFYTGGGNPQATAKNQAVMASFDFTASMDALTDAHILCDRLPYYE